MDLLLKIILFIGWDDLDKLLEMKEVLVVVFNKVICEVVFGV